MKKIRILLTALALCSLITGHLVRSRLMAPAPDERSILKIAAPDSRFAEKQGSPPVYRSGDGAVAFNSHDIVPQIRGYAGPIKVMVVLSREGMIAGLRIIEHRETKNYVRYLELPSYLSQFIGKSVTDPFEVDRDIDGITRATVSVKALADTVRESSRTAARDVLGISSGPAGTGRRETAWLWYAGLFIAAAAGYVLTRRSRKFQTLRDLSLASSVIIVGLYLSAPFSVIHVFNLVLLRPSSSMLWYVLVISTFASIIVAGRFYCGWLCPFGALSEFISRLPFRKWEIPPELDGRARTLKYGLLGLAVVLAFTGSSADYGNYEAYVTLFSFNGTALTWALVVIALAANLRIERFWCRYLCPVAALTGALSREARGYPSGADCPVANKPNPAVSECIRCNRCFQHGPAGR